MRGVKTKMTTLIEVTQGRSGTDRTRTQVHRSEPWLFTTWGQGLRAGREGARWRDPMRETRWADAVLGTKAWTPSLY